MPMTMPEVVNEAAWLNGRGRVTEPVWDSGLPLKAARD